MTVVLPETSELVTPYFKQKLPSIEWKTADVVIRSFRDASEVFRAEGVRVPVGWSDNAVSIFAQKYLRPGETGVDDVVERIVGWLRRTGVELGYFNDEEAQVFADELSSLMLHQMGSFNSPVWFNIGRQDRQQQSSACFLLAVEDNMESILNWYTEEGLVFRGGSGAGVNLSRLRESDSRLSRGGSASGPVTFMRAADASAGTIKSGGTSRRAAKLVCLDVDHPDVVEFIWCKAKEERKARVLSLAGFDMDLDGSDSHSIQYQNANNSVRLTDEFMDAVERDAAWPLISRVDGEINRVVRAKDVWREIAEAAWECADPGVQFASTMDRWHTVPSSGPITTTNPCSEFVHLDNTSCNLASLNLLKFLDDSGRFDTESFRRAVRVFITAQEILVNGDYPTEKIAEATKAHRPLGLGYTNLGTMLMTCGLPYDSDEARALAAGVTSLMTGEAYCQSARLAAKVGPFAAWQNNHAAMGKVLSAHRNHAWKLSTNTPDHIYEASRSSWEQAVRLSLEFGVRNSQVTVLAPTGTISFIMDCDTTGIEPEFAIVKEKKLCDGGAMTLVNQSVVVAMKRLGYGDIYINGALEGLLRGDTITRWVRPEHHAVFATSVGENAIEPMGHVKMVAAVQPFLSGAVSKTCNLPSNATVEDVADIYYNAWKLGLKSISIYRDNSKVSQPLNTKEEEPKAPLSEGVDTTPWYTERRRMDRSRRGQTFHFSIDSCDGYVTTGEWNDGSLGELFIRIAKQGSTLGGVMDAFAIAVSLGLQHGVPLETFVRKFVGQKFEPAGITNDEEIRLCQSIVDYVFRRLALDYLSDTTRRDIGILNTVERKAVIDEPKVEKTNHSVMCISCGVTMLRAGTCHVCPSCGTTSGCS